MSKFEQKTRSTKEKLSIFAHNFFLYLIIILVINITYSFNNSRPETRRIISENESIVRDINVINRKVRSMQKEIGELIDKDSSTYRHVLEMELPKVNIPSQDLLDFHTKELSASLYNDRYAQFISESWANIFKCKSYLYYSSVSMDSIASIANNHISFTRNIPAIWPVDIKGWRNKIDSFGYRIHPILKKKLFHSGLDLACYMNTDIVAPADGKVEWVRTGYNGGYGNELMIDHGFGYKTRYAHLNKILVKRGDVVVRGDKIGLVGSTGRSTGPHLHYEVIYKGKPVDPANYMGLGQSKEETALMLENARLSLFEYEVVE